MVYHHRKVDRTLFEKYRKHFSPYCSLASLYFWAVAGGAIPKTKDYAPKGKAGKNGQKKCYRQCKMNTALANGASQKNITKQKQEEMKMANVIVLFEVTVKNGRMSSRL